MESMILSTVEFSADSISELDKGKKSISIRKSDIIAIALRYGFTAERPIVQGIIGGLLVLGGFVLGIIPIYRMIPQGDYGDGYNAIELFAYAVPLAIIGGYFLHASLAKRFYLLVRANTDKRKLVFTDNLSFGDVQAFLMNCKSSFGYEVVIETANDGVQPIAEKTGTG